MLTEIRNELKAAAKAAGNNEHPIAIVDDDMDDQFMLSREVRLAFGPVPVETFRNGAELIAYLLEAEKNGNLHFRHHKPQLILLDLLMPRMDGNETLAWLGNSASCSDIPVIVVSGVGDRKKKEKAKALAETSATVVEKPFSRDDWVFYEQGR